MKTIAPKLLLALGLFLLAQVWAAERMCPPLLSNIKKESLTISVVLEKEDKDLTLTYGSDQNAKPAKIDTSDSKGTNPGVKIHKFQIKGLQAGTVYPYKVAGFASEFRTAPSDMGGEVLFMFGGDYNMPLDPGVKEVEEKLKKKVDFFLDLGDHLINRRIWAANVDWLGRVPLVVARGNHDNEVPRYTNDKQQLQHYLDFDGDRLDFSYEWGPVMIRVEDTPGYSNPFEPQHLTDMEKAYADTKCPWKFFGCHHVFFSDGPHGNQKFKARGHDGEIEEGVLRRRQAWPLFKKHGVRIVLNGHDHLYQRSHFIDAEGKPDPAGPMNVTFGGHMNTFKGKSAWSAFQYTGGKGQLSYVHVKGETATIRLMEAGGKAADEITVNLK